MFCLLCASLICVVVVSPKESFGTPRLQFFFGGLHGVLSIVVLRAGRLMFDLHT